MKTTLDIADSLFAEARAAADREGTTFRALVEEGLREVLKRRAARPAFVLPDASVDGRGLDPAYDTWEKVLDACYEERGG
ncbi:MAG: type II toxin-antitoxin system VapB family antitoxin [Myxococcota bacterium]